MDFELAKKILKELKLIGVCNIYYTGGEPLLYKYLSNSLLPKYNNAPTITSPAIYIKLLNVIVICSELSNVAVYIIFNKIIIDKNITPKKYIIFFIFYLFFIFL